ncbi:MAG TPA: adenylate cyclase regulatory domain-containing protein [Solirubrobacteraceae bacterium]
MLPEPPDIPPPGEAVTTAEAARRVGVAPSTLRRWVEQGVFADGPVDGEWPPAAVAHARIVARLRDRGHSLQEIRTATHEGRLAFGYVEELLPDTSARYTLRDASRRTGLAPKLIERIFAAVGFPTGSADHLGDYDMEMLEHIAVVLGAGFPLMALMQLIRVYGQSVAQIADAEVRLFHLYVHEPLLRDGVPGLEMAEQMNDLTARLLPLASPVMDHVHRRFLHHFVEQDIVGHMESDLGPASSELGRLRVAIGFADLAGYTQLTEQQGDLEAAGVVERFVANVTDTLPEDARIVKTIGDEVMVVSTDPAALTDWAVGFQTLVSDAALPRIGVHVGEVVYRDGDYYGREVNLASRVAARAGAGEVLVTRAIVEASGRHLEFEYIGEVKLKGFDEVTELFLAGLPEE